MRWLTSRQKLNAWRCYAASEAMRFACLRSHQHRCQDGFIQRGKALSATRSNGTCHPTKMENNEVVARRKERWDGLAARL